MNHAQRHQGGGGADSSMFSQALGFLKQSGGGGGGHVDEGRMQQAHQQLYQQGMFVKRGVQLRIRLARQRQSQYTDMKQVVAISNNPLTASVLELLW